MGLAILTLLAPIGLILPHAFKASGAWGEWGSEQIKAIAGYLPERLQRISHLWSAPLKDYAFTGWDQGGRSYVAYIVSGIVGTVLVAALSYVLGKALRKR